MKQTWQRLHERKPGLNFEFTLSIDSLINKFNHISNEIRRDKYPCVYQLIFFFTFTKVFSSVLFVSRFQFRASSTRQYIKLNIWYFTISWPCFYAPAHCLITLDDYFQLYPIPLGWKRERRLENQFLITVFQVKWLFLSLCVCLGALDDMKEKVCRNWCFP